MKVLITGLTLHNNKGGPALAFSLMNQLKKYINDIEFHMLVPRFGDNIEKEKKWKKIYGVEEVYPVPTVKIMLFPFNQFSNIQLIRNHFRETLKKMDVIIDLTALSYMDLPHKSFFFNAYTNISNYLPKHYATKYKIPMLRWTQSYGPFKYFLTKWIVKRDLATQKIIFSRGEESKNFIEKILPYKQIESFPDVAISLSVQYQYIDKFKEKNNIIKYITISPSAVMYRLKKEKHIEEMQAVADYALSKGYSIIFVPHNLVLEIPVPERCDLMLTRLIAKKYANNENVFAVDDDLDPMQLKGIIAQAELHIGARYHSVIAALSTATPVISLSWHNKYLDIMKMYGLEKYVVNNAEESLDLIDELIRNKDSITEQLKERQLLLMSKIEINTQMMVEMINDELSNL